MRAPVSAPGVSTLRLPVQIPKGARGTFALPVQVQISVGGAIVVWDEVLHAGTGTVKDWMVVGTEAAASPVDPAIFSRLPDQWRWDQAVRFGDVEKSWQRIPDTAALEFGKVFPAPTDREVGKRGAYAVAVVQADADAWVEWTAGLGGPGVGQELQFHLDGRELFDLRLGRETWSPKRLPMFLRKGRHVVLLTARSKGQLPEATLSIRELEDDGGGRVRPVSPWSGQ
jgi:hypothetical protein